MNKNELQHILNENSVSPGLYNIDGKGVRDQKMCLSQKEKKWQVYYTEKGMIFDLKEFDSENDACQELFDRLM